MGKLQDQTHGEGYSQRVEVYGYAAYVLDKLSETGLMGKDRESTLEFITSDWIMNNADLLARLDITIDKAKGAGYMPVKFRSKKK